MNNQRPQVFFQPITSRPFMHGTTVAGIRFVGACILIIIIASSIAFFIGLCMAAFGYDYRYCSGGWCGTYTSGVRKAGIVFTFFGGLVLIFGAILAFKAHGENKVVRGTVLGPVAQPQPGMYQSPTVVPSVSVPVQQVYATPPPQPTQTPAQGFEKPPPYQ